MDWGFGANVILATLAITDHIRFTAPGICQVSICIVSHPPNNMDLINLRLALFFLPRVCNTPDYSRWLCDIDSGSGRDSSVG